MVNRLFWLFLLFLFSLPALMPLMTATPTRSADGLLHLYRLVQLGELWRQGIFFSRWLPDVAYGYGLPLFNYYAPLVYYLTAPLHLFGISFPLALNLSLATALLFGAVGMFFFTRALLAATQRIFETNAHSETQRSENPLGLAALTAALAFLYAPYVLFNALYRANLAEQWALAFAPFALWRFFILVQKPNALNWSLAVLFFAAVLLSHNVTSFLFAPLLFFFTLACIISSARFSFLASRPFTRTRRDTALTLSAFFMALALSAFFWLPALLERDYAQIARVIVTPDFDYRFNFVAPQELIALLPRADTGRMNPAFPSTLGIVQIFLAAVGIILVALRFRSRRALPLFALALAALGFIVLMLSFSQPIWDSISLLSFVQLPMRLRGLVALCLAPFVGIFVFAMPTRWHTVSACVALAAIMLSALPLLYPRSSRQVSPTPNLSEMFAYEQESGAFGTTSFGEYLPVWVQNLPDKSPFDENYARREIPNRFVIPEGVSLCGEQIQAQSQTICVNASDSWHALYRAFYFPGWRVTLDGAPLEIAPTPRTGLISFAVEKSGTLRVEYVGTDIEHIAEWISLASAILVFGALAFGLVQHFRQPAPNLQPSTFNRQTFLALGAVALALIAFKIIYVDRTSNLFVGRFNGLHVQERLLWDTEGAHKERQAWFNKELYLLDGDIDAYPLPGYLNPTYRIKRGETLRTVLYWRALPDLQRDLSVFVHLTKDDGTVVAQQDNLHPGHLPTTRWDSDAYIADEHAFEIPANLAPGIYGLRIGVYDPRTNQVLPTSEGGASILLAEIVVE